LKGVLVTANRHGCAGL